LSTGLAKSIEGPSSITPVRSVVGSPPRSVDGGNRESNTTFGVDDVDKLYRGVTSSSEDYIFGKICSVCVVF